jgi:hypothetical protein
MRLDVLYADRNAGIVYVYSDKVSGIYDEATPSKSNVTAVTISGVDYSVKTRAATDKLSGGLFSYGDNITALLGKNGGIVDVFKTTDAGYTVGILSVSDNEIVYIKDGNSASLYPENAWIMYMGGKKTTFGAIKNSITSDMTMTVFYKENRAFDYAVIEEADLEGPKIVYENVSSYFDFDEKTVRVIRDGKISSLVEVQKLDVAYYSKPLNTLYIYCDKAYGIYEKALPNQANVTSVVLSGVSSDVLYYMLDKNGKISFLILNDVTKSAYQFGIVTEVKAADSSASYKVDFDGVEHTFSVRFIITGMGKGLPVMANVQGNELLNMRALSQISTNGKITELDRYAATIGDTDYKLSKNAVFYVQTYEYNYNIVSIDDLDISKINYVQLYSDTSMNGDGFVRVVKVFLK